MRKTWTRYIEQSSVIVMALLAGVLGCQTDGLSVARLQDDSGQVYWRARLNHHAVTLSTFAPWDTMQLSMAALTYNGDTIRDEGARIVFASSDSNLVSVSPTGYVRAKGVTTNTRIFGRLTIGALTYFDTTIVKVVVNPAPKTLGRFVFQAQAPDSAKVAFNTTPFTLSRYAKAFATDNTPMSEVAVYYQSLNPFALTPDRATGAFPNQLNRRVGPVTFVASVFAYGIAKTDTLRFVVGYPLSAQMPFSTRARIDSLGTETAAGILLVTIGVGGEILFRNGASRDVDLIFDDTTHILVSVPQIPDESVNRILRAAGNPDFGQTLAYRRFTAPGLYTYRDRNSSVVARIHVIAE